MKPDILITGATGFVGRHLCARLINDGAFVSGTLLPNKSTLTLCPGVHPVSVSPLSSATSWSEALRGIQTVFHLAARAHITHETATDPLKEFRTANTEGTRNLALQAAQDKVSRFIFISTIGVNGFQTETNSFFTEAEEPQPYDPYTISKHEAELALWQISRDTGMEVVVIRAPIVYGPSNPGNFFTLLRVVSKGIPLPLASVANKRSMIYVRNLVDAMVTCATHPDASGKTYLVCDGEDVSTPNLIRRTAQAMGKEAHLFPLPTSCISMIGRLTGKSAVVNRLLGSLRINSSKIKQELGWIPPFTMEQGLRETAEWFKSKARNGRRS